MSLSIGYCLLAFLLGISSARLVKENIDRPDDDKASNNTTKPPFIAYVPDAKCNAVIVHKQHVVVSAHSIVNTICETPLTIVKVGIEDIYGIEKITIHPKFLASQLKIQTDYDIAVIKLNKSLVWSNQVQAVDIASKELVLHGGDVLKALRKSYYDGSLSETDIIYEERKTCENTEFVNEREMDIEINDRILCAKEQNTCEYGDPGFLFFENKLVGLPYESYSKCQNSTWLYTRTSELNNFVTKIIKNTV